MPSLLATIGLNTGPFKTKLLEAQADARHAGKEMKEAFGEAIAEKLATIGTVAGMEETIRRSIELGEKVYDLSRRLGISTDAVQLWDAALRKNSSSIDSAAGFFEKLATARDKVMRGKKGSDDLVDSFKELGISVEDLRSKRIEDIAAQIAKAFEGGDPQQLIGALRSVGGRAAGEMVAAFRAGIGDMISPEQTEIRIITPDQVALLKQAADETKTIWINLKGAAAAVTAGLVERKNAIVESLKIGTGAVIGFSKGFWQKITEEDEGLGSGKKTGIAKLIEAFSEGNKQSLARSVAAQKASEDAEFKRQEDRARSRRTGVLPGEDEESKGSLNKAEIKAADHLAKMEDDLSRKRAANALAEMTAKEKLIELDRRKAEIEKQFLAGVALGGLTPEDKTKMESNLEDIRKERRQAEQEAKSEEEKSRRQERFHTPEVNALQRIGAYVSPEAIGMDTAKKSEAHLSAIREHLANIDKESRHTRY